MHDDETIEAPPIESGLFPASISKAGLAILSVREVNQQNTYQVQGLLQHASC